MSLLDLITMGLVVFVLFNVVLGVVLVVIYAERKILARLQQRMGPMRTGPHGIFQTLADAVKLLLKEDVRPADVDLVIFYLSPIMLFVPIFMLWVVLPISRGFVLSDLDMGLFYVVAVLGLSVVGMVLAGWSSNNKYALLGSARSAAQLISYELPLILSVLGVAILAQTALDPAAGESIFNLTDIVKAQGAVPYVLIMPLGFFLFMVAALAETGRIPFDIPHAQEEIVGGPFVEYSGIRWGVFFLAEYAGLITMAFLGVLLFLGGWSGPLSHRIVWLQPFYLLAKVSALIFLVFWLRAPLPRLRIDQLMAFAWKLAIPMAFLNLLVVASMVFAAAQYDWPAWLLKSSLSLLSLLSLGALFYGLGWRRERRLAQFRTRWAQ